MSQTAPMQSPYLDQFAARAPLLPGAANGALRRRRELAMASFAEHGFPTVKVEAWKFTNLNALARAEFVAAAAATAAAREIAPWTLAGAAVVAFVNGCYRADLSDAGMASGGVDIVSLARFLEAEPDSAEALLARAEPRRERALMALNTALAQDGAVIRISRDVAIERPIQLLFLTRAPEGAAAMHARNLILLEPGAAATVIETHAGAATEGYWSNVVTQVALGDGASLRHYKLQDEGKEAFHTALTDVALGERASYASFALSLGGRLARNEIDVTLAGDGASCRLDGVNLARGRQHLDTTTRIVHAKPHGSSSESYRSVVDDRGHAVFQGRVSVAVDAQKSDARQLNQNLLLSDAAQVDSKPELEILADDVKCSHGATVGDLDPAALFYLRARGIGEATARALLIEAFAGELIDAIEHEATRAQMRARLGRWLSETGDGR